MRALKFLLGLALLPLCVAASRALGGLLSGFHSPSPLDWPLALWALLTGLVLWLVIYFFLPRPVRAYVLAHELTHAFWALLMGGRVSRLKVTRTGGSVTMNRCNFLVTLAPYFFPLYTFLIIGLYYLLLVFFDVRRYELVWLGLVGFTWGFHATFTCAMLFQDQPDIRENGRLFSYAVIYLINILGVGLWIVAISAPTLHDFGLSLSQATVWAYAGCQEYGDRLWDLILRGRSPRP